MEKTITKKGINGEFTGIIRITKNYTSTIKEIHNRVLHEEIPVRVQLHKVEALMITDEIDITKAKYKKTTPWKVSDMIENESTLENISMLFEDELDIHLHNLANNAKIKTFEEKMSERGYK